MHPCVISSSSQRGFSLIELILVMTISTLLLAVVYQLFAMALQADKRVSGPPQSRLVVVEALLKQDLLHMRNRRLRDAQGDPEPAFRLVSGQQLSFVRGGLPHIPNISPGGMSRVSYLVRDNQLVRQTWPSLDLDPGNQASEQVLLTDLRRFDVEVMDSGLNQSNQWPTDSESTTENDEPLPSAIIIRVERRNAEAFELLIPGHGHV